jgi:hypothetical protein
LVDGRAPVTSAATSTEDFIAAFKEPLSTPILLSPANPEQPEHGTGELDDSELVPKRSARLAAKSRYREPKPKAQARKVMMKKLDVEVETQLLDEASFDEFQTAFALPLSSSTREAMNVLLFLGRK